ncbi:MAG: MaoC family dehydratase [Gammaproteobacteria bacterium]|nr:MaoC family dehydratase [Gammaproteobacteria bacterium]MDH3412875.1 MaoC family dehydratase [Gammaproteobacteria bacterium]
MLDRTGFTYSDLSVGMSEEYIKTITDNDIVSFAEVSGDTNPMHLDDDFASETLFRSRIAHGMLTASLISTIIGTLLPGPGCIYLGQNLKFLRPVRIGDAVLARVVIEALIPEKKRVALRTTCAVNDKLVLDGDALVMVPERA